MDTYSIRVDGSEVARVTGDGITSSQRAQFKPGTFDTEVVDDPKLLKLVRGGKTILVFYVSQEKNVSVERVSE